MYFQLSTKLFRKDFSSFIIIIFRETNPVAEYSKPFLLLQKHVNSYSARRDNWCTVGGDGGCRVGEVRAGTTSPMPDHKGFKLQ